VELPTLYHISLDKHWRECLSMSARPNRRQGASAPQGQQLSPREQAFVEAGGVVHERAYERTVSDGGASASVAAQHQGPSGSVPYSNSPPAAGLDSSLDMDVTVLAFAQWANELKTRQWNSNKQLQNELNTVKNAINSNHVDLSDFKRHGAAIQQQMQIEINEIRESLSNVFSEITTAVRNHSAADQELKHKIQSLNEQAVRNETAFAQLADAADQSQSKLRGAVNEMQRSSERMRDDLLALNQQTDWLHTSVNSGVEQLSSELEQLTQDVRSQVERKRVQIKKMANDVLRVGELLQNISTDFTDQRREGLNTHKKLHTSLTALDLHERKAMPSNVTQAPVMQMSRPSITSVGAPMVAQYAPQGQVWSRRPSIVLSGVPGMPAVPTVAAPVIQNVPFPSSPIGGQVPQPTVPQQPMGQAPPVPFQNPQFRYEPVTFRQT
jgi:hypothetical protein